ncbi:hypothetical protein [Ruminococcus flavefaciens]|nr:hypothetical protein [Ruminococcus flavefaciens]
MKMRYIIEPDLNDMKAFCYGCSCNGEGGNCNCRGEVTGHTDNNYASTK